MRKAGIGFMYFIIILISVELLVRMLGFNIPSKLFPSNKRVHQPDSILGWKPIAGTHSLAVNLHGDSATFTFGEGYGRVTKASRNYANQAICTLVGGSFFFGVGVDDNETCAWKLQELIPDSDVRNLSVGAYGTYQALLVLEDQIAKGVIPKCVIYGLISHHRWRNVASADWLETINYNRHEVLAKVPYATLNEEEEIIRHPPTNITLFPLSDKLVSVYMAQRAFNKFMAHKREQGAGKVMGLLIREMQRLCSEKGISFYVAVLHYENDHMKNLVHFFDENGINHIDCNVPLTVENTIRDDGHPIASVHTIWAQHIAAKLEQDRIFQKSN